MDIILQTLLESDDFIDVDSFSSLEFVGKDYYLHNSKKNQLIIRLYNERTRYKSKPYFDLELVNGNKKGSLEWTSSNKDLEENHLNQILIKEKKNLLPVDVSVTYLINFFDFVRNIVTTNYCFICQSINPIQGNKFSTCKNQECISLSESTMMDDDVILENYRQDPIVFCLLLRTAFYAVNSRRRDLIYTPRPLLLEKNAKNKGLDFWTYMDSIKKVNANSVNQYVTSIEKDISKADSDNELADRWGHDFYGWIKHIIVSNRTIMHQGDLFSNRDVTHASTTSGGAKSIISIDNIVQIKIEHHPKVEETFKERSKTTCYLYHGSSAECWYSILRNGLRNASGTKLQVNGAAYGAGIYLSNTASLSMGYSRGQEIVMAVCEVLGNRQQYCRGGSVYTCQDETAVLLRYLLVFGGQTNYGQCDAFLTSLLDTKFGGGLQKDHQERSLKVKQVRNTRLPNEIKRLREENGITVTEQGHSEILVKVTELDNEILTNNLSHYGIDGITFRLVFPDDYPIGVPFIFIQEPQLLCDTGQITDYGALAIDCLTPARWRPVINIRELIRRACVILRESKATINPVLIGQPWNYQMAKESYWELATLKQWF